MPAVTNIATHQQDECRCPPLALLMVWMMVALRMARATMRRIASVAMPMIGTAGEHIGRGVEAPDRQKNRPSGADVSPSSARQFAEGDTGICRLAPGLR